jgi:hypothetical protein
MISKAGMILAPLCYRSTGFAHLLPSGLNLLRPTQQNPLFWGAIAEARGLFLFLPLLFLPRHNRVSQGRRMVYDHLMLPIWKISRFRHGAEVALSAAANRDATARALNGISAYSCMATSAIMLAAATFIG